MTGAKLLTEQQLKDARRYNNKALGTTVAIRKLQKTLGVTPSCDRMIDRDTILAVAEFQKLRGLTVDGKVGPVTAAALEQEHRKLSSEYETSRPVDLNKRWPSKLSVWVDDGAARVIRPSFAQSLRDCGITEAALMANKSNISQNINTKVWSPRWTLQQLEKAGTLFDKAGIKILLTSWPRPNPWQIDAMTKDMEKMLAVSGSIGWDVDCEGNWHHRHMYDFTSMQAAAEYLVASMREAVGAAIGPTGFVEMDSFAQHSEFGINPTVSRLVDKVAVQAYSVATRRVGRVPQPYPYDGYLGPGRHQLWAYDRVRKAVGPDTEIIMGLPAWNQVFPNVPAAKAMAEAAKATASVGVNHIRYWSSKWIVGGQANSTPYSRKFLKILADGM